MFLMNHYHYLPIKKTFIICEYMLNVSYRIFYEDYKSSLDGYVDNNLKISQKCLELDVKNIVNCLKNKIIRPTDCSLKKIEKNIYVENRFIE
jgi:hypothetical protein